MDIILSVLILLVALALCVLVPLYYVRIFVVLYRRFFGEDLFK